MLPAIVICRAAPNHEPWIRLTAAKDDCARCQTVSAINSGCEKLFEVCRSKWTVMPSSPVSARRRGRRGGERLRRAGSALP